MQTVIANAPSVWRHEAGELTLHTARFSRVHLVGSAANLLAAARFIAHNISNAPNARSRQHQKRVTHALRKGS